MGVISCPFGPSVLFRCNSLRSLKITEEKTFFGPNSDNQNRSSYRVRKEDKHSKQHS